MLRIKSLIKEKKTTIRKVAEKMEVSPQYISAIVNERKNPSLETLVRIADALNVPVGALFEGYQTPESIESIKNAPKAKCPYCGNTIVLKTL